MNWEPSKDSYKASLHKVCCPQAAVALLRAEVKELRRLNKDLYKNSHTECVEETVFKATWNVQERCFIYRDVSAENAE